MVKRTNPAIYTLMFVVLLLALLLIAIYINNYFSHAKFSSYSKSADKVKVALFDVNFANAKESEVISLSSIDNTSSLYEFQLNNNSEVSVNSEFIITLKDDQNNVILDNQYLKLQVIDKESNETFDTTQNKENGEYRFDLGNMTFKSSKDYYLKISIDDYKKVDKKQQISIHAVSSITQAD